MLSRMHTRPCVCISLLLLACQRARAVTSPFDDATASSKYAGRFGAEEAIGPGSGYWCSAGNHFPGELVTLTASLQARRRVVGLDLEWAYSPGETKVLVSKDGANFEEVQGWRATRSDASFKESVMFPEPVTIVAVTLAMRSPRAWSYFGLNRIEAIAELGPLMLVSGMTSLLDEQCLVASGSAALEPCLSAIAAMDGREIFELTGDGQLLSRSTNQCVVMADGPTNAGVSLQPCLKPEEMEDGRSAWQLQPNGQLKTQFGNTCLVAAPTPEQQLPRVGAAVSATSTLHGHPAQLAADGNEVTYWASQPDPAEQLPVDVLVELGAVEPVFGIEIHWKHPARQFEIQIATDNLWITVNNIADNNLNHTRLSWEASRASKVRVRMKEAHRAWGSVGGHATFAIRNIKILKQAASVGTQDCSDAARNDAAGDKFFSTAVGEFDSHVGSAARNSASLLHAAQNGLGGFLADLSEAIPQLSACSAAQSLRCDEDRRHGATRDSNCSYHRAPEMFSRAQALTDRAFMKESPALVTSEPSLRAVAMIAAQLGLDTHNLKELVTSSASSLAAVHHTVAVPAFADTHTAA